MLLHVRSKKVWFLSFNYNSIRRILNWHTFLVKQKNVFLKNYLKINMLYDFITFACLLVIGTDKLKVLFLLEK